MIKCYKCKEESKEIFINDQYKIICKECLKKEMRKENINQTKKLKKSKRK